MTPADSRPAIEALDVTLPALMADLRAKQAEQEAAEQRAVDEADYVFHTQHGDSARWEPWEHAAYAHLMEHTHERFHPEQEVTA